MVDTGRSTICSQVGECAMAAWQFDFHLLPFEAVAKRYGGMPVAISRADFEETHWWMGCVEPDLQASFAKLLPALESWSDSVQRWGDEQGNRIDVVTEGDTLEDVFVRVDVRNISQVFLIGLLEIARRADCVLLLHDGRVIRPSFTKVLTAIRKSDAFRFVENTDAFLRALERARETDPDDSI